MKVSHSEGVANHAVPESCALRREAQGEALTGERAGQPLSREIRYPRAPTPSSKVEGNTSRRVSASTCAARRGRRPWHVRTLLAREPGDLAAGRVALTRPVRVGKARSRSRR